MADTLPTRFGRFEVLGEIGRGAMGVVYRAQDTALGRAVAIKTVALTGDALERDLHEARFLQEARAAGGISHPAIVTIYDVGREGDHAFIAMELLEGVELKELIRAGSLRPSHAITLAASVAEGLGYAHERGVVHRDIKPGNIMVLRDGRVKIMDFGIARLQEPTVKTQTGVLLGSPQYMSPEQISGRSLDARSDIFSLGVVLYEMLTGTRPFDSAELTQVLFWIVNLPAKAPGERRPGLPPVLDYIVARALKKQPEERYASAAELAADLRDCLEEVKAAEKAELERRRTGTVPGAPQGEALRDHTATVAAAEQPLELRPSPRFDSVEGLARLAVLPAESEATQSRAGWTMPMKPLARRVDRARAMLIVAYVFAALVALAIVVL